MCSLGIIIQCSLFIHAEISCFCIIVIECGALTDPENGNVSVSSLVFESIATYACHTDYNLTGDATRTCLADKMWSGAEPTCFEIRKYIPSHEKYYLLLAHFVSMSTERIQTLLLDLA